MIAERTKEGLDAAQSTRPYQRQTAYRKVKQAVRGLYHTKQYTVREIEELSEEGKYIAARYFTAGSVPPISLYAMMASLVQTLYFHSSRAFRRVQPQHGLRL